MSDKIVGDSLVWQCYTVLWQWSNGAIETPRYGVCILRQNGLLEESNEKFLSFKSNWRCCDAAPTSLPSVRVAEVSKLVLHRIQI
jgi:hypothetical protein